MKAAEQIATSTAPERIQPDALRRLSLISTLAANWPEYAIEATLIALFMFSAATFGVILENPASPLHNSIASVFIRRGIMGVAMGITATALIYSPIGKRSGAHYNPSVTLTFFRLGKIAAPDVFFYIVFQLAGGVVGVLVASLVFRGALADPAVHYVITVPGSHGEAVAFVSELTISFLLMSTVLYFVSHEKLARFTGLAAGTLVATFITFEAPLSGMSMNFARTLGSASFAKVWTGWWIYLSAPLLGMIAAAEVHSRFNNRASQHCAKLHHDNSCRCIFCGANGGSLHE